MVVDLRPATGAVVMLVRIRWGVIGPKSAFVGSHAMPVWFRWEVYVRYFSRTFFSYIGRIHIVISEWTVQADWRSGVISHQCTGGQYIVQFSVDSYCCQLGGCGLIVQCLIKTFFRFKSDTPYQILSLFSGSFSLFFSQALIAQILLRYGSAVFAILTLHFKRPWFGNAIKLDQFWWQNHDLH